MELENIIVVIIFSLIFLAAISMSCSVCLRNIQNSAIVVKNVQIFPKETDIESNMPIPDDSH
jgi:hypothetical protein